MEKSMNNVRKMMKRIAIIINYFEEEIVIDIKYVDKETENMMLLYRNNPVSLLSLA